MPLRVVMLGASGAVGREVMDSLCNKFELATLTLLNRRPLPHASGAAMEQHIVDVLNPQTYKHLLGAHQAAVCALGVGQPSAVSDAEFVRVDKDAVIGFARACKEAGVAHFELLSSVGADARSRSLYLRTKGELCDAVVALGFQRLSPVSAVDDPDADETLRSRAGPGAGPLAQARQGVAGLVAQVSRRRRGNSRCGDGGQPLHQCDRR